MTHLFIATLSTETNTFSPIPTTMAGFEEYYLRHGTATQDPPNLMTEALHLWRARAEALGWEVSEGLSAIAEPAGRTTAATYEALKAALLEGIPAAPQPDVILLQLHGAMAADGIDDCEGDLLAAIRAACPDAVIGVSLDLHCHLTAEMTRAADLIVCFKEYPHDDATPRAQELFDMAADLRSGTTRPTMAVADCNMIGLFLTKAGAMQDFVARLQDIEAQPGVLSVSLAHGFPWADVADVGTRVLVITDGDKAGAQALADQIAAEFRAMAGEVVLDHPDLDTALDQALEAKTGPVVIADMSDNPGAGAPGDATFVLTALLERGIADAALGIIWDPEAVAACVAAGEGKSITLSLGGKAEPASGTPVVSEASICRIRRGLGQHLGTGEEPLGTLVHLRIAGIDVLVNDLRVQVYHPEAFEQMGVHLAGKRLVVVKSTFHFFGPFGKIASRVIFAATPGRVVPEFRAMPYTKRPLTYWPRVE